jgi:hypothetical protein
MNTKSGKLAVRIVALLASALLCAPAFAQHGGGGFGGGGHMGGGGFGGGGHMGGGGHFAGGPAGAAHFGAGAAHFAAPNYGAAARFGGTYRAAGAVGAYGYRGGYVAHTPVAHSSAYAGAGWHGAAVAHSGVAVHGSTWVHGGWGWGWHGTTWGGGWWHGAYWPHVWYGWAYPWFIPVLPAFYTTFWWGGVPFFYVNNVYYTWDAGQNGYVVTDPPPVNGGSGDASGQGAGAPAQGAAAGDVFMYPRNGQTDQQQAQDRFECHQWAQSQTGFDPTTSGSGGNPDDYRRAMIACLDGRGYSAR